MTCTCSLKARSEFTYCHRLTRTVVTLRAWVRPLVYTLTLSSKHAGAGERRLSLSLHLRLCWQTFDRRSVYDKPKVRFLHCCNQITAVATSTHNTHLHFGTIRFHLQYTAYYPCTSGGVHHHCTMTALTFSQHSRTLSRDLHRSFPPALLRNI